MRSGKHTESQSYRHLYKDKRWFRIRQKRFILDGYTCRLCGKLCTGQGKDHPLSPVCDHIEDHKGDERLFFDIENTRTLHKMCHDKDRRQIDSKGYSSAIGEDGWPISPDHPANRNASQ